MTTSTLRKVSGDRFVRYRNLVDTLYFLDWNPVTTEQVLKSNDDFFVYAGSKALTEREMLKFAESHPEIDITTSEFTSYSK